MNIKKKIALAAIPAVMALSATDVSSKVLLMSDNGWEVSFDGAANAFYTSSGTMDTIRGFTTNIRLVVKPLLLLIIGGAGNAPNGVLVHSKLGMKTFRRFQLVYYQMFGVLLLKLLLKMV